MSTVPPSAIPPWYRRGVGNYTYVAFADGINGEGFTVVHDSNKAYLGIVTSEYPVETVDASLFTGKWITRGGAGGLSGSTNPEGIVVADVGITYLKTETAPGADDEEFYVKGSSSGTSSGWIRIY